MTITRRAFFAGAAGLAGTACFRRATAESSHHDPTTELRERAWAGLEQRLQRASDRSRYAQRLDYELTALAENKNTVPMLFIDDALRAARARGVVIGYGLGSASSSLVCWSLGITGIDPIEHGLFFERFIARRSGMLSIWLSASSHAGLMAAARATTRWGSVTEDPPWEVPSPGTPIPLPAYNFSGIKLSGLHELRCSEVAELCTDRARSATEQAQLFAALASGDDVPLIGYSSRCERELIREVRPRSVTELAAVYALYRPGPVELGIADDYAARARSRVAVHNDCAVVSEVLGPTFGVLIFQEQTMEIAARVAGLTLTKADEARRALGKHKDVQRWRQRFLEGALRRGVSAALADDTFELLVRMTPLSFMKSHAIATAVLAVRVPAAAGRTA